MIPKKRTIVKNLRLVSMIILWLLLCFVCNDRTYLRKVSGFQKLFVFIYFKPKSRQVLTGVTRLCGLVTGPVGRPQSEISWTNIHIKPFCNCTHLLHKFQSLSSRRVCFNSLHNRCALLKIRYKPIKSQIPTHLCEEDKARYHELHGVLKAVLNMDKNCVIANWHGTRFQTTEVLHY